MTSPLPSRSRADVFNEGQMAELALGIPVGRLPPGRHLLTIAADSDHRDVPFDVR